MNLLSTMTAALAAASVATIASGQCGSGGSCYTTHGPGCDDVACCTAVCAVDPFCCAMLWDTACVSEAGTLCAVCGGEGAGSCFSLGSPYCDDLECCEAVCASDPYCCNTAWDTACVNEALAMCGTCGGEAAGSCFETGATYCNDAECCEAVCDYDPFCCEVAWDSLCVNDANVFCATCGGAGAGSCYEAGATFCNDADCCEAVCGYDAFCCDVAWDSLCVNEANVLCKSCGGAGAGSCYIAGAPYCNDADCCNEICAYDPYCCATLWDAECVDRALEWCIADVVAGPYSWVGSGNQYYLLEEAIWQKAEAQAIALGGHLVTINTALENEWVRSTFGPQLGGLVMWIGFTDKAIEGTYVWLNGEPVTYLNWGPGEPNNQGGDEDYTEMFKDTGAWNDIEAMGSIGTNYAVVEVEGLGCGNAAAGNCFYSHIGNKGCDDQVCCMSVCAIDGYCCNIAWDSVCANEARTLCDGCGDPTVGTCLTSKPSPYCANADCCETICALDSYCCNVKWDSVCVNEAYNFCLNGCPGDINDSGSVNPQDLAILLGNWGTWGGGDLDLDGNVGAPDLAILLGAWGPCP